ITSPISDITIPAGNMVSFSTTSSAAKYSWVFPGGSPATSTLQNPGNVVFNTPGTYVASLTVIDSSGNSDPSPPTRTITVLPTSATPYALSLTITGTAGAITHTASTTLLVNLAAPAGLTATPGNAQVSLAWPASVGATSYDVKRATVSGGPYTAVACATTTSY